MKILARANKKLRGNGKFYTIPEPTKSWFYVTEYDSNGYFKAKTIGCSGDMPYRYMYGTPNAQYPNITARFLQEFEINDGVTNIGDSAFSGCRGLTSIVIPNSVTSIVTYAFNFCSSLSSITIPSGVTSIGNNAFNQCTSLASVEMPDSVKSIGTYAFYNCTSLKSIIIPSGVTSIPKGLLGSCKSLTNITMPDGVTSIGENAFSGCTGLKSIIIPSGVISIGANAFSNCGNCSLFDFRKATQVPTLSNVNAFYNTPSSKKIVVPDALYDSWITATNWSSTTNNIVTSIIKASDYEASL